MAGIRYLDRRSTVVQFGQLSCDRTSVGNEFFFFLHCAYLLKIKKKDQQLFSDAGAYETPGNLLLLKSGEIWGSVNISDVLIKPFSQAKCKLFVPELCRRHALLLSLRSCVCPHALYWQRLEKQHLSYSTFNQFMFCV